MQTIHQAVQYMENHEYEKALQLLNEHLEQATDDEKFTIAHLYRQWGFLQQAKPIVEDLMLSYPNEGELKTMLADIYIELEDDEAAIQLLNDVHEDDPFYVETLLQLADLYEAQGLYEVAESKLLTAKRHRPDEPIIDFALGELNFFTGHYQRAINHYERIKPYMETIGDVSIIERLAEAYAGIGEYEMALQFFEDISNDDPDILFKHGLTAYYAGEKSIAIHQWKRVIEYDKYYHTVYFYLAKVYHDEGLIEEAYDVAEEGLKVDSFNKELYELSGRLAQQLGYEERSEEFFQMAVKLDPEYKEAVIHLIELFKRKYQDEKIIHLLKDIQKKGANDPLYDWELARASKELEDYSDALHFYQRAYPHLKYDGNFLKEYAYFLVEEGRVDEALSLLTAYLKLEPLDDEVEAYVERLRQDDDL